VRPWLGRFDSVRFQTRPTTDPELLHTVGEALDAGLHAAAERQEHRVHVMERILARARDVQLEERGGGWVANGRYRVGLDPMSCECPAWSARWAKAPIAGRRAQRLPCKHLVALALRQGVSVPADLALLARRAPP
jgi:SWIM zinc finger